MTTHYFKLVFREQKEKKSRKISRTGSPINILLAFCEMIKIN